MTPNARTMLRMMAHEGWTLKAVADRLHVSTSVVGDWRAGKTTGRTAAAAGLAALFESGETPDEPCCRTQQAALRRGWPTRHPARTVYKPCESAPRIWDGETPQDRLTAERGCTACTIRTECALECALKIRSGHDISGVFPKWETLTRAERQGVAA